MFSGPSDFFLTHGYSHRCICGEVWYDSDGGPCHVKCADCGEITDDPDEEGNCPDCHAEDCPGCGDSYTELYLQEEGGLCENCKDELEMLKSWPDDELALHLEEAENFTCKQAIEQFEKRIKGGSNVL